MYGVDFSCPSRTIALCPAYWLMTFGSLELSWPACPALKRPRLYSAFVIVWNAFPPWPVNASCTIDLPVFGSVVALMPDSTRSFPVSSGGPFGWTTVPFFSVTVGRYLNRYQYLPSFEVPFRPAPMQLPAPLHQTGSRFAGTLRISVFG